MTSTQDNQKSVFPNTRKYLATVERFREAATVAFYDGNSRATQLIAIASEIVASSMLFISGRDLNGITHGLHIGDLIVSFTRSHFIVIDLLVRGELIEAATLLRKQLELVARIHQAEQRFADGDRKGRPPNVKYLHATQIRRFYGEYSEIAHSNSPEKLGLLGFHYEDGRTYTAVYPVFHRNAYTALNHACLMVLEFFACVDKVYAKAFVEYDGTLTAKLRDDLLTLLAADAAERPASPQTDRANVAVEGVEPKGT